MLAFGTRGLSTRGLNTCELLRLEYGDASDEPGAAFSTTSFL